MKISNYFCPSFKNISSDIKLTSHKYAIRAGLVKQCGSGIYTWLPLGTRIISKIKNIINKEMSLIGFNKIIMPCIQQSSLWKQSGRYESYGKEMLKIKDRHGQDMLFGPTCEELSTDTIKNIVQSYKQLPIYTYQIQWKFRDEIRPRFGLLRSREFLMKDGYSFDINKQNSVETYYLVFTSYLNIFKKIGINVVPTAADPGPIGGDLSHEFHIINDNGSEEEIIYDPKILDHVSSLIENDINKEFYLSKKYKPFIMKILNTYSKIKDLSKNNQEPNIKKKGIEIAHTFSFGTKYADSLNAKFKNMTGDLQSFYMGSYGIGVSRLVGAIIESSHDEKGIIWPESIAPFQAILINLHKENIEVSEKLYTKLDSEKVLFDDTNESPGTKLSRADLFGIPYKIIISKKTPEGFVEYIERKTNNIQIVKIDDIINKYK